MEEDGMIHIITFLATVSGVIMAIFRTIKLAARARRRIREDM